MFTRQHYEAIAGALRKERESMEKPSDHIDIDTRRIAYARHDELDEVTLRLARMLGADSTSFRREPFLLDSAYNGTDNKWLKVAG